jgi:3-isopropylmalate/(R)-2-methylmalate dehydratase small subunit
VWALTDYGFTAVISPRFGDIFRNNSTKAGLVPVQVSAEAGRALLDAVTTDPALDITIDIERGTVSAPAIGLETTFPLDEFTRYRLVEGLDDVGLTLRHETDITGFEGHRPAWAPRV